MGRQTPSAVSPRKLKHFLPRTMARLSIIVVLALCLVSLAIAKDDTTPATTTPATTTPATTTPATIGTTTTGTGTTTTGTGTTTTGTGTTTTTTGVPGGAVSFKPALGVVSTFGVAMMA